MARVSDENLAEHIHKMQSGQAAWSDISMHEALDLRDCRAEIADRDKWDQAICSEDCPKDEKHCGCVPALRKEIERLREEKKLLSLANQSAVKQNALLVTANERLRGIPDKLLALANLYEKDGKPGPRGYNSWGWREMAKVLREAAKGETDG